MSDYERKKYNYCRSQATACDNKAYATTDRVKSNEYKREKEIWNFRASELRDEALREAPGFISDTHEDRFP